jgi:1-acyl-sn-glycerol-3-phosphate acyltransferase
MIIRLARAVAAWALTAVFWTIIFLLQAATLRRLPEAFLHECIRRWGRGVLWILGIRLEVEGGGAFETAAPRVIVFNHQSALDVMLAAAIAPPGVLAVGKKEINFVPFVNLAWWALDFMTVDRKRPRKMVASMTDIAAAINRDRRSFLAAPEGTRTRDGSMLPFKHGPFQIAVRAQVPVYPVLIWGAFDLLPRSGWLPRPGTIRIRCLAPVETRGAAEGDARALAERVRSEMERVYESERSKLI